MKINIETGAVEVIADGFKIPAAANIDPQSRDDLYVIDTATGSVWKVSLSSKAKRLVATLKPGLDNLAFDSRGRLFVTSMTDNGIYLVDKVTGAARTIVEGKLAIPTDLAVSTENGKDTVHVADVFSYRTVDGSSGAVSDVLRVHGDTHSYPLGISVGPRHVLLSSWFSKTVEKVDRKTGKLVATLGDFAAPVDAVEMADGTLYVAELGSGNLVKVSADGKERSDRRQGAARRRRRWRKGRDNMIYVTENRRRRGDPDRRRLGRAQGGGRRAGRPRRHRCRARRQALRRRGRPEAHRRDRSGDGRQDGDRLEPRYRPARPIPAGRRRWCRPASRSAQAARSMSAPTAATRCTSSRRPRRKDSVHARHSVHQGIQVRLRHGDGGDASDPPRGRAQSQPVHLQGHGHLHHRPRQGGDRRSRPRPAGAYRRRAAARCAARR